ncbi:hypothetical protein EYF80_068298 [Liparis tanakae]|uniref:Uncharacterized protein n=1 Tax=Liparis tanakae TaxID=230148 RepID=A0A4Z2DZM0_9TELE|nr:hypothetical protein EYF80_068298 [Liparis tanakae]
MAATASACWTASGARWTATGRRTWTRRTAPCRRNASGASSAPRARTPTGWASWVSDTRAH